VDAAACSSICFTPLAIVSCARAVPSRRAWATLPVYAVIGKRAGCRGVTDVALTKRNEIREPRYENTVLTYAQLFDAQLFDAVDSDNVKFGVFLANLECSLKFRRIAPAFQRLHAFPPQDHNRPVRQVSR
jgi:hypothetical protein